MYNIGNQTRMRRLLGKSGPEPSPQDTSVGVTSSPITPQTFRPSVSQNATFAAGSPIKCMDESPDRRSAVLAGHHILKTVRFDGLEVRETLDLRSLITANATGKNPVGSSVSDQLSIRDVKWAPPQTNRANSTIFTACSNGRIFQYDLARAGSAAAGGTGLDFVQIREDSRQVNTLDVNPHRGTLLLSGSQDGITRCFDIRIPVQAKAGLTFRSGHPFKCNDSVRQVKWSPKDAFYFACSTDQGVVLKWDIRKHVVPMLKIKAHEKICYSVDWHPDGEHLVSAGGDARCHVWDLSSTADKKQKPRYTISTPAPASVVAWRPGHWSATARGRRTAQIAVSYEDSTQKRHGVNSLHIWDLARPTMPYKEIQSFDSLPSALLWHDQDLLWTAGQDGLFNQCDIAFSPRVLDRQTVSSLAFSARGGLIAFLDERTQPQRPRFHVPHQEMLPQSTSLGSSPNTPMLSISRSDSEDELVGNFLGSRRRGGGGARKRRPSTRSAHVLSTTPPSADDHLSLHGSISMTGIYKSQQAMVIGRVPAATDADVYRYLSANYLETLHRELPSADRSGKSLLERVLSILEHYARAAENVRRFRLAQTWRILAYGLNLLLKRRAQYHLEFRMERLKRPPKKSPQWPSATATRPSAPTLARDGEAPRADRSGPNLYESRQRARGHSRSALSEEIESTSNVPTPLVRPQQSENTPVAGPHLHPPPPHVKDTSLILESDRFALPPAVQPPPDDQRQRLGSLPLSIISSQDSESSQASQAITEGYDFYDTDALSHAIDVPRPGKKPPVVLDTFETRSPNSKRGSVLRHDSDGSFSQISSASGGSRRTADSGGEEGSHSWRSDIPTVPEHAPSDERDFAKPEPSRHPRRTPAEDSSLRAGSGPLRQPLMRTETELTNFTDEHHMITQTTSDSFTSRQDDFPSQTDIMYGSPEGHPYWPEPADLFAEDESPHVVDTDYLSWPDDPPYPHPIESTQGFSTNISTPLNPHTLISRALDFEVRSSALNASAMVLLLKPLVSDDVIDPLQASAILHQHHTRLMGMRLFVEAALLRKLCLRGWPGGSLADWGDNYPAIFTPAQQGGQIGLLCSSCRKPREIDRSPSSRASIWRCERCRAVMAPCAVCGHRDSTPNLPIDPVARETSHSLPVNPRTTAGGDDGSDDDGENRMFTWWYCHGCGHGGHSTCLQSWHAASPDTTHAGLGAPGGLNLDSPPEFSYPSQFSDGCCPMDGCGHACLSGRWRMETAASRTEEVSRAVRDFTRAAAGVGAGGVSYNGSSGVSSGLSGLGLAPGGPSGAGRISGISSGTTSGVGGFGSRLAVGGSNTGSEYGPVRGDANEAIPSRAVDGVREMLSSTGSGLGREGILSSSPGTRGERVERERRKSVKFVGQDDRPR